MLARKGGIVKELTDGVAMLMKKNKVTVFTGRGTLTAPGKVTVSADGGDTEIEARNTGRGRLLEDPRQVEVAGARQFVADRQDRVYRRDDDRAAPVSERTT